MRRIRNVPEFELYSFKDGNGTVRVSAGMTNGSLSISGYEIGGGCEDFWGDEDYEYFYRFSEKETEKLLTAIGGLKNPAAALAERFGGADGCARLCELCGKEQISYEFSSYV